MKCLVNMKCQDFFSKNYNNKDLKVSSDSDVINALRVIQISKTNSISFPEIFFERA